MQSVRKVLEGCGGFKIKHQQSDAQLHRSVCSCMGKQGFAHECMNLYTLVPETPSSIIEHYSLETLQSGFTRVPSVSHRHWHDYAKNEMGHGTCWNVYRVYVCVCACVVIRNSRKLMKMH